MVRIYTFAEEHSTWKRGGSEGHPRKEIVARLNPAEESACACEKKNYCQGVGGERDLPPSTSVGWVTVRTSREFTSVTKRNDPLQLISSSPVFFLFFSGF